MENLFSVFHKIIVAGGAIVSSVLPLTTHSSQVVSHILPTPTVVTQQHTISIDKTINAMLQEIPCARTP